MGGANERVRPSKREAEQAVILLRCRQDRAPPLVHGAHVRAISHCLRARPYPLPLPLGGLTRDAARSSATLASTVARLVGPTAACDLWTGPVLAIPGPAARAASCRAGWQPVESCKTGLARTLAGIRNKDAR